MKHRDQPSSARQRGAATRAGRASAADRSIARRAFLATTIALLGAVPLASMAQQAAAFPNRPVRMLIPFAAGSGTDIGGRLIAEELGKALGQNVIVENRPGASAQIAAEMAAKAPPDGHTIFLTTNTSHSANPFLFKKLPYDPVKDFAPIARTYFLPFVLVVDGKLPVHDVAELAAFVKANPDKASYGYGNSTGQVAGAAFRQALKLPLTEVPYKSTPPAIADIIGGSISFMFVDLPAARESLRAGRLRAIAVTTGKRSTLMPEVPAVGETPGLEGFDLTSWGGLFAPAGTPPEIVARLSESVRGVLGRKEVVERFAGMSYELAPSSPSELAAFVAEQLENWGTKVREAGIQPE
ncbi:MAG: tripartite tricarboxylate transporter substrate binding protein [Burkholderiaceae bacterium]